MNPAERVLAAAAAARLHGTPLDIEAVCAPLGVPLQLVYLAGYLTKHIPGFDARFCFAASDAGNLDGVWPRFAIWLLREVVLPTVTDDRWGVRAAVEGVADAYERGNDLHAAAAAAHAAADAAYAYAHADAAHAASMAYAAAYAAYAASMAMARVAAYAAHAADAATHASPAASPAAAAYAAYAAAYAAYAAQKMADKLIELIRGDE